MVKRFLKKGVFLNCWHMNDHESAALWKVYVKGDEGVALRSTVARLISSFPRDPSNTIWLGKVNYIDYQKEKFAIDDGNLLNNFFHKRRSFEHEKELRAVYAKSTPSSHEDEKIPKGVPVEVDVDTLIEKVFVSPTSPGWFRDLVDVMIKKYGLAKEVIRSSLADDPIW